MLKNIIFILIILCINTSCIMRSEENNKLELKLLNPEIKPTFDVNNISITPTSEVTKIILPTPIETMDSKLKEVITTTDELFFLAEDSILTNDATLSSLEKTPLNEEDDAIVVEENAIADPDTDIILKDSENSPDELLKLIPENAKIESSFALCEDSIYMKEWEKQFSENWLKENSTLYKNKKQLEYALIYAKDQAYMQLLFPAIGKFNFDYPVIINRDVMIWVEYFLTKGRRTMVTWMKRAADAMPIMLPILEKNGLPQDLIYLAMIESGFNYKAFSIASATGPWQFMRATGQKYGLKIDDFVDERRDPVKATVAASKYLSDLYKLWGDWHLATASYNAGEGRVGRALARSNLANFFALTKVNLLPNETRNYVPKLIAAIIINKNAEKFGFEVSHKENIDNIRIINLEKSISLRDLAKQLKIELNVLQNLNPELRGEITPPKSSNRTFYALNIPKMKIVEATKIIDTLVSPTLYRYVRGRVTKTGTVTFLANKMGISLNEFLKANPNLTLTTKVSKGKIVYIPVRLGTGKYEQITYKRSKNLEKKVINKKKISKKKISKKKK